VWRHNKKKSLPSCSCKCKAKYGFSGFITTKNKKKKVEGERSRAFQYDNQGHVCPSIDLVCKVDSEKIALENSSVSVRRSTFRVSFYGFMQKKPRNREKSFDPARAKMIAGNPISFLFTMPPNQEARERKPLSKNLYQVLREKWSFSDLGNIVNRKPPRGGGIPGIKVQTVKQRRRNSKLAKLRSSFLQIFQQKKPMKHTAPAN